MVDCVVETVLLEDKLDAALGEADTVADGIPVCDAVLDPVCEGVPVTEGVGEGVPLDVGEEDNESVEDPLGVPEMLAPIVTLADGVEGALAVMLGVGLGVDDTVKGNDAPLLRVVLDVPDKVAEDVNDAVQLCVPVPVAEDEGVIEGVGPPLVLLVPLAVPLVVLLTVPLVVCDIVPDGEALAVGDGEGVRVDVDVDAADGTVDNVAANVPMGDADLAPLLVTPGDTAADALAMLGDALAVATELLDPETESEELEDADEVGQSGSTNEGAHVKGTPVSAPFDALHTRVGDPADTNP